MVDPERIAKALRNASILNLALIALDAAVLSAKFAPLSLACGIFIARMASFSSLPLLLRGSRVQFGILAAFVSSTAAVLVTGFSVIYFALYINDPHSFYYSYLATDPNYVVSGADFVYFSVTTATTAGYGDFVPVSPPAKLLAATEMIIGVLFTSLIMSILVAKFLEQRVK